jgi:anthranilate phosphoribosyltransferase
MLLDALANTPGTPLEIVVLNAGAALYVAGIAETLINGIERARAAIASGDARRRLDLFVATTRALAEGGRAGE